MMKQKCSKNVNANGQLMRAVSTSGGCVMFVPDQMERRTCRKAHKTSDKKEPFSYKKLIDAEIDKLIIEAPRPLTALERLEKFAKKVERLKKAV